MNWRRKINSLRGLNIQGVWVDDPLVVKGEVKRVFENKFNEEDGQIPISFEGLQFNSLDGSQAAKLVELFTEEEIKEAVWSCEGNKSPGPDGFNFNFIKSF